MIKKVIISLIVSQFIFLSSSFANIAPVQDATPVATNGDLTIIKDKKSITSTNKIAVAAPEKTIAKPIKVAANATNNNFVDCSNKQGKVLQDCINLALKPTTTTKLASE